MKSYIFFLLTIACMVLIFYFSSKDRDASVKQSTAVVRYIGNLPVLEKIEEGRISSDSKKFFKYYIRKFAHFFIYFVLSIFVYMSLKKEWRDSKKFLVTVIVVFLYACSDESHQMFVKGRDATFSDVMIDTIGGFVGVFVSTKLSKIL